MDTSTVTDSVTQSVQNLTVSGGQAFVGNQFTGTTAFNFYAKAPLTTSFKYHYAFRQARPVKTFVDRSELIDKIEEQLAVAGSPHGGQRCVVLHGMGGSGKTQLALRYLQRHKVNYDATFWVSAASPANLHRDMCSIYRMIFNSNIPNTELPKIDQIITQVRDKMNAHTGRILLVCDSLDSIDDVGQSETAVDITSVLPDSEHVDVIITSRSPTACHLASGDPVEIVSMSQAQSVELFSKAARMNLQHSDAIQVQVIVSELGYLPLAISLAGAYVAETPRLKRHLEAFLPEFRAKRTRLMQRQPKWVVDYYSASLLTTWESSFDLVKERVGGISAFLGLLACMSPDDLSVELLLQDLEEDEGSELENDNESNDGYDQADQIGDGCSDDSDLGSESVRNEQNGVAEELTSSKANRKVILAQMELLEQDEEVVPPDSSHDDIEANINEEADEDMGTDVSEETDSEDGPWWAPAYPDARPTIFEFEDLFAALESLSLIHRHANDDGYSMHHLIHAWAFERMTTKAQQSWTTAMLHLSGSRGQNEGLNPSEQARLVRHVSNNIPSLQRVWRSLDEEGVGLLYRPLSTVCDLATQVGLAALGEVCSQYILIAAGRRFGEKHPRYYAALSCRARSMTMGMKFEEADEILTRLLSPDCSGITTEKRYENFILHLLVKSLSGKSHAVQDLVAANEQLFQQVENEYMDSEDADLETVSAFSWIYFALGRTREAVDLLWTVIGSAQASESPDDPRMLDMMAQSFHKLSQVNQLTQRHDAQISKLIQDCAAILGPDDDSTVTAGAAVLKSLIYRNRSGQVLAQVTTLQDSITSKTLFREVNSAMLSDIAAEAAYNLRKYRLAFVKLDESIKALPYAGTTTVAGRMSRKALDVVRLLSECLGDEGGPRSTLSPDQHRHKATLLREYCESLAPVCGPGHFQTVIVQLELGESLEISGQLDLALTEIRVCIEKLTVLFHAHAARTLDALLTEARILRAMSDGEAAAAIEQTVQDRLSLLAAYQSDWKPDVFEFERLVAVAKKVKTGATIVRLQKALVAEATAALGVDAELTKEAEAELSKLSNA